MTLVLAVASGALSLACGGGGAGGQETPSRTSTALGTPLPPSGLTLELVVPAKVSVGQTVQAQVRIRGTASASIGAFNLDLVYDETQVRLQAPVPSEAVLMGTERDFSCDLPPPSADVEPATSVGRARLACFSFGDEAQQGLSSPAVLATIALRPLVPGTFQLEWEAVDLFAWDGANLGTIMQAPARVIVR